MRRENFNAKRDLKALYCHKLDKLKATMLEERQKSENAIKDQLKFQKHAAEVHKRRADTYRQTADELAMLATTER